MIGGTDKAPNLQMEEIEIYGVKEGIQLLQVKLLTRNGYKK